MYINYNYLSNQVITFFHFKQLQKTRPKMASGQESRKLRGGKQEV